MKKLLLLTMLVLFSLLCLPTKANAASNDELLDYGVQNGVQTTSMTIDEGLQILGYNPSSFYIKETLILDDNYNLSERLGRNGINPDYGCPVEFLGVTESYENLDSGYIDSYIYFYTPYRLDATEYFDFGEEWNYSATDYLDFKAIMLMVNEDKMKVQEDYEGFWINIYGYQGLDFDMQYWTQVSGVRPYVTTDDEDNSISQGVTRICFRVYTVDDLKVKRNYYIEKFCYEYSDPVLGRIQSNVTPSFNVSFSPVSEDGEVDSDLSVDPGYSDSTMFKVTRKSVIMVEAEHYVYNYSLFFGLIKKCNDFIVLRNKNTGQRIENCVEMQIIFKLDGDKQYREVKQSNTGKTLIFKVENVFSKNGQFFTASKSLQNDFKKEVIPKLNINYPYEEMPDYMWAWNYKVNEVHTVYIWTEVEAGTVVQGSCYENGLHVEYDENGNALGVFDANGNYIENIKYTNSGIILNDDGSYRLPENSAIKDVIYDGDDTNQTLDKILVILELIVNLAIVILVIIVLFKIVIPAIKSIFKNDSKPKNKK